MKYRLILLLTIISFSPVLQAFPWKPKGLSSYDEFRTNTLMTSEGVRIPGEYFYFPGLRPDFSAFPLKTTVDSSRTFFTFRIDLGPRPVFLPVVWKIDEYIQQRLVMEFQLALHRQMLKSLKISEFQRGKGLELKAPVKFKSKTFRKIFGGDQIGLRVTGNLSMEMAGRVTKYPGALSSAAQRSSVFSPRFKQSQQFQIEGNIGEKVTVSVQQNSDATFDFENTLKVIYDGDDDEIIQSIQAGNVSLNLPGTRYVSGSASSAGLFGLKSEMKIGKLNITSIASLEKGEKNKVSLQGGVDERPVQIYDYNYVKNQFFFVDSFYIPYFEKWTSSMDWILSPELQGKRILDLEVWVSITQTQQEEAPRQGVAAIDPEDYYLVSNLDQVQVKEGEVETAYFKRLVAGVDYGYDEYRGFFYLMRRSLEDNEVLGIAYRLEDGSKRGKLSSELDSSSVLVLKLIKPRSLNPSFTRAWKLMMKNVYDLGGSIPADFNLDIVLYRDGSNQNVQPQPPTKTFINILGLDRRDAQGNPAPDGDGKVDVTNGWIFLAGLGKLIFPSVEPFNPTETSFFKDLHPDYRVDIYNSTDQKELTKRSKFMLEFVSRQASSTYNLGFNVMENSEEVFLNGRKLERGKDYTIDYFTGELNIINTAALAGDAKIEINYESATLFQLNKKTLLGTHARYEFDKNNFLTFTTMYLNKSTIDDKVRLGQEPTQDIIWDLQGRFQKESRWVTMMLNKLPFVESEQLASLTIDAEMAQILPNPNTRNNPKTGDNDGVAYIDDFEGSERKISLGIGQRIWTPASIPEIFAIPSLGKWDRITLDDPLKMFQYDSSRVHVNWYLVNANIKDIWPNREVSARTGTITSVLRVRWRNEKNIPRDQSWFGLMRSTKNFPNQQRTRFIEILVRGDKGRLNIDIGTISEDFYIRGTTSFGRPSLGNLNTEDRNLNGFLDEGEDTGLDGVEGDDNDPNRPLGDDGQDDYKGYNETDPPYYKVNGTEGNSRAAGERYPDTEDIDGDFNLNLINSYFEYSFSLDPNDPESQKYVAGETESGWRLYRIPIRDYDKTVGNPDTTFQRIYFVRFWLNDLPDDAEFHYLDIAAFDFVGYDWESIGIARDETQEFNEKDSLFLVTVYNTEENTVAIENGPEPYHNPPGVEGALDRINNIRTKEQSLVLRALKLAPGELGAAEKILLGGQRYDLAKYKKLKLFIHGDWKLPEEDSPLIFRFRFGHSDNDYYEVIQPVYPHWDRNTLEIMLDELSATKNSQYLKDAEKNIYERVISSNGKDIIYRVVGRPSVNNISYLRYILENKGNVTLENTEVWVDELRASEARKDPGTAMRISTRIALSDLLTYDGQIESKDADFHQLGQTVNSSAKTTELLTHNVTINTQNFFPRSFRLNMPVNFRYSQSRGIPKFYRGSDRLTNYGYNSILDRIMALLTGKAINTELMGEIDFNESFGYTLNLSRNAGPKDPFIIQYTLNQLKLSYNYSDINAHNFNYSVQKNETEKINLTYQIPFGRNNFVYPFGFFKNVSLLKSLGNYKLFYTPSGINMGMAAARNQDFKISRLSGESSENSALTLNRNFGIQYPFTDNINLSFSRSYNSDASDQEKSIRDLLTNRILNGQFGTTTQMNQKFTFDYKPRRWTSFFTPNYSFSSNFNYSFSINNEARRASLNRVNRISGTLNLDKLAAIFYQPSAKPQQKTPVPPKRTAPKRGMSPEVDDDTFVPEIPPSDQKKDQKEDSKEQNGRNPVKMLFVPLWKTMYALKSIRLDYTITENANYINIDRMPESEFIFGFKNSASVKPDTTFNKLIVPKTYDKKENFTSGVQFSPFAAMKINLDYNLSRTEAFNADVVTTTRQNSYFVMGDKVGDENSIYNYIPNWQVSLSGLEKYFGLNKYFNTINLEHKRSGSRSLSEKIIQSETAPQGENYTNQYQPFLRISTRLKWGVDVNISYNSTYSLNKNPSGGDTKSDTKNLTLNASFSRSGGMSLFFLPGKKLKNDVRFNLQIQFNDRSNFLRRPDVSKFDEMNRISSFTFQTSVNYTFSRNVVGEFFILRNTQQDKRLGKSSQFELGAKVNITLR